MDTICHLLGCGNHLRLVSIRVHHLGLYHDIGSAHLMFARPGGRHSHELSLWPAILVERYLLLIVKLYWWSTLVFHYLRRLVGRLDLGNVTVVNQGN